VNNPKSIVLSAVGGEITLLEAERRLRGTFGSGIVESKYQQIYNYLDEVAGMLEGIEETEVHRKQFSDYLKKIGFGD
jgi:hypothetical protein